MRESVLHDLYFCKIHPWDRRFVHSQEYRALSEKMQDITTHFYNLLSSEEYARLDELQDLQAQADIIDGTALFAYAFRLGAKMMLDILDPAKND